MCSYEIPVSFKIMFWHINKLEFKYKSRIKILIDWLTYLFIILLPILYFMVPIVSGVTPMGSEWANPRAPELRGHPQGALSL